MSAYVTSAYIIEVEWDRPTSDSPNPPSLVGPFPTRVAAEAWAEALIRGGSWNIAPLASPALGTGWKS